MDLLPITITVIIEYDRYIISDSLRFSFFTMTTKIKSPKANLYSVILTPKS